MTYWYTAYENADALIVLGHAQVQADASQHCAEISEKLSDYPSETYSDLLPRIVDSSTPGQLFWTAGGNGSVCRVVNQSGAFNLIDCNQSLPGLCTQSAPASAWNSDDLSYEWHIQVHPESSENLTGYRDRRSFRFLGIPFAVQPERWTHSVPLRHYSKPFEAIQAGPRCKQQDISDSSEDCLSLDIYTPYLPMFGFIPSPSQLKPVMVFVHGGSFTTGDASDSFSDGGNLASRGDVVVVSINYRLGIFGFLALDDGSTNGNYGLHDQITALKWLKQNIKTFGGDADRITMFGQSAGAASIRALLSSPLTQGMISGAIMQSSPGGRGMGGPYSQYQSISEVLTYINPILDSTGCSKAKSQIECLRKLSGDELVDKGSNQLSIDGVNQAFIVEDGKIINTSELILNTTLSRPVIPVILGTMRDDGALFLPGPDSTNLTLSLLAAPLSLADDLASTLSAHTNTISLGSALPNPLTNTSTTQTANDIFSVTSHYATLGMFSCAAHATALAGSLNARFNKTYLYQMNRAFGYYPNTPICNAPVTPGYPNGNPYTSLNCHSGDNAYVFGNIRYLGFAIRDQYDLPFARQMLDSWASFARTGNPNPDPAWMRMIGYDLDYGLNITSPWIPSIGESLNLRRLGPMGSAMIGVGSADDAQTCKLMGLPVDMYT